MTTNTKIIIAKIIFRVLFFFGIKKDVIVKRNLINWKLDILEGIDLSIFLFGSFQQNFCNHFEPLKILNTLNK